MRERVCVCQFVKWIELFGCMSATRLLLYCKSNEARRFPCKADTFVSTCEKAIHLSMRERSTCASLIQDSFIVPMARHLS